MPYRSIWFARLGYASYPVQCTTTILYMGTGKISRCTSSSTSLGHPPRGSLHPSCCTSMAEDSRWVTDSRADPTFAGSPIADGLHCRLTTAFPRSIDTCGISRPVRSVARWHGLRPMRPGSVAIPPAFLCSARLPAAILQSMLRTSPMRAGRVFLRWNRAAGGGGERALSAGRSRRRVGQSGTCDFGHGAPIQHLLRGRQSPAIPRSIPVRGFGDPHQRCRSSNSRHPRRQRSPGATGRDGQIRPTSTQCRHRHREHPISLWRSRLQPQSVRHRQSVLPRNDG